MAKTWDFLAQSGSQGLEDTGGHLESNINQILQQPSAELFFILPIVWTTPAATWELQAVTYCLHILVLFPLVSVPVHISAIILFSCFPACSSMHFSKLLNFAGKRTLLFPRKWRDAFPVIILTMLF